MLFKILVFSISFSLLRCEALKSFRSIPFANDVFTTSIIQRSQKAFGEFETEISMTKTNNFKNEKYSKSNLPEKVCCICQRKFSWRKKWRNVWDEVKYCSEKCRGLRGSKGDITTTKSVTIDPFSFRSSLRENVLFGNNRLRRLFNPQLMLAWAMFLSIYNPFPGPAFAESIISTSRPTTKEINEVFDYYKTPSDFESFDFENDFRRLDESLDSKFYESSRFVEHIDAPAIKSLILFHDKEIALASQDISTTFRTKVDILDLCSSWVSHISPSPLMQTKANIIGLGMNEKELNANKMLSKSVVQDLNSDGDVRLPFGDKSFDIVLLQLSVDYLIHPIEVLKEANRVLRDDGSIYISFSNRMFIQKAVAVWTGKSDLEHIEIVGRYLHFAGGFQDSPTVFNLSPPSLSSDPLYVVKAKKHAQ